MEVVITTLMDHFGEQLLAVLKRKEWLVLVVCIVAFFLGFPNITNVSAAPQLLPAVSSCLSSTS